MIRGSVEGRTSIAFCGGLTVCGTGCSPFGVDRQWVDAYIPPGGTTNTARVVLVYHDFFGPSQIWVNLSADGGKTYGRPIDVLANLTGQGANQGVVAQAEFGVQHGARGSEDREVGSAPGPHLCGVDRL